MLVKGAIATVKLLNQVQVWKKLLIISKVFTHNVSQS